MKIQFLGAARTVTGSKHLLILDDGRKILLDFGLFQGKGEIAYPINRSLGIIPEEINALILSHAHIDHSGNIPYLVKNGYSKPIFCTPATRDLNRVMLLDSAHIQEMDTRYYNKREENKNKIPLEPLYTQQDVDASLNLMDAIPYNQETQILENVFLTFTDTGHILGSAAINLRIKENNKWTTITFTGDIGRYNGQILRDPQTFPQADYIICESTYGNKLHDDGTLSKNNLLDIIKETCLEKKGKLIIPAFSLGRTQEILYAMDQLANEKRLPQIPVFVDSPLSYNVTEITRKHIDCFNDTLRDYIQKDTDPFGFRNLTFIQNVEDSKRLNDLKTPCIIISASGMIEAGRIKHHVRNNISNPKNTILIVGYCEPSTLGGRLASGVQKVSIFKETYPVKAAIKHLHSFSAHGDYQDIIKFLSCQKKTTIKNLFLVHGEYDVMIDFQKKLLDNHFHNVVIPQKKQIFNL